MIAQDIHLVLYVVILLSQVNDQLGYPEFCFHHTTKS